MFNVNPDSQPNGFAMKFDNGYTVSVQWGQGNYCANRDTTASRTIRQTSQTAEVVIFDLNGKTCGERLGILEQDCEGYRFAHEVAAIIYKVSRL